MIAGLVALAAAIALLAGGHPWAALACLAAGVVLVILWYRKKTKTEGEAK